MRAYVFIHVALEAHYRVPEAHDVAAGTNSSRVLRLSRCTTHTFDGKMCTTFSVSYWRQDPPPFLFEDPHRSQSFDLVVRCNRYTPQGYVYGCYL